MPRFNYRDIRARFSHIDGRIEDIQVRAQLDGVATARVVLCFYPWWEHPLYLAARDGNRRWGFNYGAEAAREVVVEAIDPVLCTVRRDPSAIDINFADTHPEAWAFEDAAEIICNSGFDHRLLFEALERSLPGVGFDVIAKYLSPFNESNLPYSLGRLPFTLFHATREHLEGMGVQLFIPREPERRAPLITFTIDGEPTIVASDFVVDVPEFEHRPEWFAPHLWEVEPAPRIPHIE